MSEFGSLEAGSALRTNMQTIFPSVKTAFSQNYFRRLDLHFQTYSNAITSGFLSRAI